MIKLPDIDYTCDKAANTTKAAANQHEMDKLFSEMMDFTMLVSKTCKKDYLASSSDEDSSSFSSDSASDSEDDCSSPSFHELKLVTLDAPD